MATIVRPVAPVAPAAAAAAPAAPAAPVTGVFDIGSEAARSFLPAQLVPLIYEGVLRLTPEEIKKGVDERIVLAQLSWPKVKEGAYWVSLELKWWLGTSYSKEGYYYAQSYSQHKAGGGGSDRIQQLRIELSLRAAQELFHPGHQKEIEDWVVDNATERGNRVNLSLSPSDDLQFLVELKAKTKTGENGLTTRIYVKAYNFLGTFAPGERYDTPRRTLSHPALKGAFKAPEPVAPTDPNGITEWDDPFGDIEDAI
jgi:hypothetical protein